MNGHGGTWRARLADEHGITVVEMLLALVISLVVFGAVLTLLDSFLKNERVDRLRNETQDTARSAIDRLSRDLRNAASPSAGSPGALEKSNPYDLMFQTVSGTQVFGGSNAYNQMRVRYCLDASNPAAENLWLQTQTWTTATAPAAPDTSTCPSSAWPARYLLVAGVTNENNSQNRALFTYAPLAATSAAQINAIEVDLFLDPNPGSQPSETELKSGIYLRNSNAPPTASFTVSQVNGHVLLNGSGSSDPNGQSLSYQWTLDGSSISGATTQSYDAGTFTSGSSHTFGLIVTDTVGLSATSAQTMRIS